MVDFFNSKPGLVNRFTFRLFLQVLNAVTYFGWGITLSSSWKGMSAYALILLPVTVGEAVWGIRLLQKPKEGMSGLLILMSFLAVVLDIIQLVLMHQVPGEVVDNEWADASFVAALCNMLWGFFIMVIESGQGLKEFLCPSRPKVVIPLPGTSAVPIQINNTQSVTVNTK